MLLVISLQVAIFGIVFAFVLAGVGYYSRAERSVAVNKAIYIVFGVNTIGSLLWFAVMFGMIQIVYSTTRRKPSAGYNKCYCVLCNRRLYR